MRDPEALARRWLHDEADGEGPAALAAALDRLCARLHDRLVPLVGRAGFAALLARALHLAQVSAPALAAITPDDAGAGTLRGTDDFAATRTPEEVEAGLTGILAQFLGLLVTFIGEALTVRLLGELWPGAGHGAGYDTGTEAGR